MFKATFHVLTNSMFLSCLSFPSSQTLFFCLSLSTSLSLHWRGHKKLVCPASETDSVPATLGRLAWLT